jgi:hypothetical protein
MNYGCTQKFLIDDIYFRDKPWREDKKNKRQLDAAAAAMRETAALTSGQVRPLQLSMPNLTVQPRVESAGEFWTFERDRNVINIEIDCLKNELHILDSYVATNKREQVNWINPLLFERSENLAHGLTAYRLKKNTQGDHYYIQWSQDKHVNAAITCTSAGVSEQEYFKSDGRLPLCEHEFISLPLNSLIKLRYERKYLPQWKMVQENVAHLINQFHQATQKSKRNK